MNKCMQRNKCNKKNKVKESNTTNVSHCPFAEFEADRNTR